jgi:hypothetical protein
MLKRTVELELADFPEPRTTIAPPFYAVQLDIAMGFPLVQPSLVKKPQTASAVVIVCLLTSATSIHVIEKETTADVLSALERHASRYGVPAKIFVDSGSQLVKLKDARFSIQDIQRNGLNGVQIEVIVATPKAHQAQGRVEAKVKTVRSMIQALANPSEEAHTLLGWETVFARVASALDDVPIARGGVSTVSDLGWEIITPNRLKLGRNNHRQLSGHVHLNNSPKTLLERNRRIQERWYEIFKERVLLMVPRPVKLKDREVQIGDVAMFVFDDAGSPNMWEWRLGVVERRISRTTVEIRYVTRPGGDRRLIKRSVRDMSIVVPSDEVPPMSPEFFKTLSSKNL